MKTNTVKHAPTKAPNSITAIGGFYRYGVRKYEMNASDLAEIGTTPLHMKLPAIVEHIERIVTKRCGGFSCKVGYMHTDNGITKFGGPNCEWEVTFRDELSTACNYQIIDLVHQFNTDKEAFSYAHDSADDYVPVTKEVRRGEWFSWDTNGNFWVNVPNFIYVR